jgi:L-lactate utilization protein LutB
MLNDGKAGGGIRRQFGRSDEWDFRSLGRGSLDFEAIIRAAEKIFSCLQCGTCGSACPVSVYMDYTPRRLIGMVREGFKQEVVTSFAIWLCASCYERSVRCPAGIRVTEVMYALKRVAIREGIYPRRFPVPVLAKEFIEMLVKKISFREDFGDILAQGFSVAHMLASENIGLPIWLPCGPALLKSRAGE